MTRTIRELTSAIASGDTEAFACFYERWFDAAYAEARRASRRDEQFCLDIVQDAMLRAVRSIGPMESETEVRAWLAVVVQSCCYDRFRREKRRRRRENASTSGAKPFSADVDRRDRMRWLIRQLLHLDSDQVHLLTLRFRFGWTLQRIGESLQLKPGAVDGRLTRTLAALRRKAKEEFPDELR